MISSLQAALIQKDQEINFYKNQVATKGQHPLDIQSAEENVLDEYDDDDDDDVEEREEVDGHLGATEHILEDGADDEEFEFHNQSVSAGGQATGGKNSQLCLYHAMTSNSTELTPYKIMLTGGNAAVAPTMQRSYGATYNNNNILYHQHLQT